MKTRGPLRSLADFVDLAGAWVVASLKEHAPKTKGRLLDVGCGDMPYRDLFLPYVAEYVGIEHEASFMLTSASTQSRKPDLYYDGKRLPFEDASFDSLLCNQVLEHTPEPGSLMAEMARVLKPGGVLLLSAPFSFRLHEEPHDYFRYTPHGLRYLAETAGLTVESIQRQGGLFGLVAHKLNSYLSFRVLRVGALGVAVGKLGHEAVPQQGLRWWLLPFVAPMVLLLALVSKLFDRLFSDPTETLSFFLVARKAHA